MKQTTLNMVVGIATTGRREQLTLTLQQLLKQERLPNGIVVCPVTSNDVDLEAVAALAAHIEVVHAPRGLCSQRNAIMRASSAADVVVFFDDDFYPESTYLQRLEHLLLAERDVVIATGAVLADGAPGPGISHEEALHILAAQQTSAEDAESRATYGGYGCNMALRMNVVRDNALTFDEDLPMYGWLEDIDFSRRASPYGRVLRHGALRGVHLGTKSGRASGVRLGYSQLANPIHMLRKGSMARSYAFRHMWRNICANLVRSFVPEPWVDRRGRLRGNMLAARDYVRGTIHPRNILDV